MTNLDAHDDRPHEVLFYAVLALIGTAVGCAILLLWIPRPAPLELPTLVIDRDQARAQVDIDQQLAAQDQGELGRELYQTLRDVGRAELEPDEARGIALEKRIRVLKKRAHEELDAQSFAAVRAYATQRSMLALHAQLEDENEERELIGAQRSMFASYGYISPEGTVLAPELTLRTMFKVRWNMVFADSATADLKPIERFAYEGFRALEAENMPATVRGAALEELVREGGGLRAERALAIFQAAIGKAGPLIARVQNSEQEAQQLRLRNMAINMTRKLEAAGR